MIWFDCKQCGKRHGRVVNLAGTLVFCECGHGNRVPWVSTAPEPEVPATPTPPPVPRGPRAGPWDEEREPDFPSARRPSREARRPNPAYCFNHDERASEEKCQACHCSFCSACVVTLQGQTLCGPCKNFRIRGLQRPLRVAPLAIVALVASLVSGPVTFVLTLIALNPEMSSDGSTVGALMLCLVSLLLPAGALVLGILALRNVETRPRTGGRSMAMTGATAALVGVLWGVSVALMLIIKQRQG